MKIRKGQTGCYEIKWLLIASQEVLHLPLKKYYTSEFLEAPANTLIQFWIRVVVSPYISDHPSPQFVHYYAVSRAFCSTVEVLTDF